MKKRKFTIVLTPGHEWKYKAQCLEIPQARSEGNTKQETLKNVKEAIEVVLEHLESQAKKTRRSELIEVNI